jgi:very-short-patch-repair endonuclease
MAAVIACGQVAWLSYIDAAVLWGFYERTGPRIHVTVKSHRSVQGLVLHRTRRIDLDEVTARKGIPVTTVARTLVDLSEGLGEDRLLRAMREAEFKRLLDLDALSAAVERAHGRRGISVLRRAIALHRPGAIVRGELEHRFAELLRGANLEPPRTNVPIATARGTYILDCYWPDHGIAVELDGQDAHERQLAFESDRRRDAALGAIGIHTVRFTWQRIAYEPEEVLADLTAAMNLSSLSASRS